MKITIYLKITFNITVRNVDTAVLLLSCCIRYLEQHSRLPGIAVLTPTVSMRVAAELIGHG